MATKDEILNNKPAPVPASKPVPVQQPQATQQAKPIQQTYAPPATPEAQANKERMDAMDPQKKQAAYNQAALEETAANHQRRMAEVGPAGMTYEEFLKGSEAQRQLDKQKEERERRIAGIGDTMRAIANLYYTTKGAPNAFDPTKTAVRDNDARWAQLKAEQRQIDNDRANIILRLRANDLEDARYRDALAARQEAAALERAKLARLEAEDKAEAARKQQEAERKERETENEIAYKKRMLEINGQKADDASKLAQAQIRRYNAEVERINKAVNSDKNTVPFDFDGETIEVPKSVLGDAVTIGKLHDMLKVEEKAEGDSATGKMDVRTMAAAIGASLKNHPEIADYLRAVSGKRKTAQGKTGGFTQVSGKTGKTGGFIK